MADLCRLSMAGDANAARARQERLLPLHNALFVESNPIPVKWALAAMGLMPEGIRLPLTPLTDSHREPLRRAMVSLSLLS
jgi:dihydrodipicolinate synthase/N-acetylneuraminate lyase